MSAKMTKMSAKLLLIVKNEQRGNHVLTVTWGMLLIYTRTFLQDIISFQSQTETILQIVFL